MSTGKVTPRPNFRLELKHGVAIGPGKAALLEHVAATGSIRAAAQEMGMGYRTAWLMIESMNQHFRQPLVDRARGGSNRGGAQLTGLGEEVLRRYRTMEQRALKAIAKDIAAMEQLIKED